MTVNTDVTRRKSHKNSLRCRLLENNTAGGLIFDILNYSLLGIFSLATIYPFIYVLSCSLSAPYQVEAGNIYFLPKDFTLDAYRQVIQEPKIWLGFVNTVIYTVTATVFDVIGTFCVAYPLSKKNMVFKNFWFMLFFIPAFLSAGLIPNYMLYDYLGLIDNRLVMIIPGCIKIFYVILVRNYIMSIPEALEESATIDGANQIKVLFRIIIPLSLPILATIALFKGVTEWNKFMDAIIYLKDPTKYPITVIVYKLLIQAQIQDEAVTLGDFTKNQTASSIASLKNAVAIITILPIILVYPYLQKYFVKGILIGSVKG